MCKHTLDVLSYDFETSFGLDIGCLLVVFLITQRRYHLCPRMSASKKGRILDVPVPAGLALNKMRK